MPVAIEGLRGTGEFTTDFRPTNYRELYTFLEPNGSAPLQALLAMTQTSTTDDPKYNHFRDEMPDRTLTINNGPGYTTETNLVVDADDDSAFIVPGTLIRNMATGEVMQATAVFGSAGANTVSVTRNIGGTSHAITDNDELAIIGHADQEAGSSPNPVSFDPTTDFNYTQIFKTAVSLSNTLKNTRLRTGDKEQEMLTKALKMHMSDIERAFFFGVRHITNGSTSTPTRYTGGLLSMINNVIDAASGFTNANAISEKEFDRQLIESIFDKGSRQKIMFGGPRVVTNMMEIGKNRWSPDRIDGGAYGLSFTRYTTFTGDLMVYLHPMFRQIASLNSTAVILDLPYLGYKAMQGRDTALQRDIQANDFDGVKHQYLTECGLEMLHSKTHWVIKNWQGLT